MLGDGLQSGQLLSLQRVYDTGGELALQEISRQKANVKNRIAPEIEETVSATALVNQKEKVKNKIQKIEISGGNFGVKDKLNIVRCF